MVRVFSFYLDAVNQRGGIDGHPVKALVFDDQGDPKQLQDCLEKVKHLRHWWYLVT
jgi:ABC-type branched-subunit amino acid transport system substrate-binding protein